MEIEINGTRYILKKPSGYKLLKIVDASKDQADLMRDLINTCVISPQLTKDQIELLPAEEFFVLSLKVNELLAEDLKKLQELMKLSEK